MTTVHVVMTAHDRRAMTEGWVRRAQVQAAALPALEVRFFVTDDGSTDGTAEALAALGVTAIPGSGTLYWAAGMALAEEHARRDSPDFLLWANDDVLLDDDAFARLAAEAAERSPDDEFIRVGAMRAAGGAISYSGLRLRGRRPGAYTVIDPAGGSRAIDSFHGNLVLVSRGAYRRTGGIDARYSHAYGDLDYGLRARAAGVNLRLMPGTFGVCELNSIAGTWQDPTLGRARRVGLLLHRKAFPWRDHLRYSLRHGGRLGPLYFLATYLNSVRRIVTGRRSATVSPPTR